MLKPEWVTRRCTNLARAAGLGAGSTHSFRHFHAIGLLAKGVDTRIVSNRLGHASTAITSDLYQHVTPEIDAAAVARMPTLGTHQHPARDAAEQQRPTDTRRRHTA